MTDDVYEHPALAKLLAKRERKHGVFDAPGVTPPAQRVLEPIGSVGGVKVKAARLTLLADEISGGVEAGAIVRYRNLTIVFLASGDVTNFGNSYNSDPVYAVSQARKRALKRFVASADVAVLDDLPMEDE